MTVAFVFKNPNIDSPGACHQGLGIMAENCALSLREMRIDASARPVPNGEYLWSQLANDWSNVTHVILSAPFIDATFLAKLLGNFPQKRFAMVYHSNLGFLSQDQFAGRSLPLFMRLEQKYSNFTVAANCAELSNAMLAATGLPCTRLPNLYHLPSRTRRTRTPWSQGHVLHIGLFGAARVLKNWLTAGTAAMIICRSLNAEVHLHVSGGRDEGSDATRASLAAMLSLNQQVQLVNAPWMGHDDFIRYLYGMDLLLQPSFTESFNNVTADGCCCGVPSVVSEAIDWVPAKWIAKGDSAMQVAKIGISLLRDRRAADNGWKALDSYNSAAKKSWLAWL